MKRSKIAESDKKKIPQIIRWIKILLIQCNVEESTFSYFEKKFSEIEKDIK